MFAGVLCGGGSGDAIIVLCGGPGTGLARHRTQRFAEWRPAGDCGLRHSEYAQSSVSREDGYEKAGASRVGGDRPGDPEGHVCKHGAHSRVSRDRRRRALLPDWSHSVHAPGWRAPQISDRLRCGRDLLRGGGFAGRRCAASIRDWTRPRHRRSSGASRTSPPQRDGYGVEHPGPSHVAHHAVAGHRGARDITAEGRRHRESPSHRGTRLCRRRRHDHSRRDTASAPAGPRATPVASAYPAAWGGGGGWLSQRCRRRVDWGETGIHGVQ